MIELITGMVRTPEAAATVVKALEADGVPIADIGLVTAAGESEHALAVEGEHASRQAEAMGAGADGVIHDLVAGLTLVSGIGADGIALVAVGPLLGAFGGVNVSIPRRIATSAEELRRGAVMVGVRCPSEYRRRFVVHLLRHNGAEGIAVN